MGIALVSILCLGCFMTGLLVGLFILSRRFIDNFILWVRPSMEGQDKKASGKAITAFIMAGLVVIIVFFYVWFAVYALMRQAAISPNELSAAHYPIEVLITIAGLITALWGIGTVGNAMMTKFTNPQPPVTNLTVQTDKANINQPQ